MVGVSARIEVAIAAKLVGAADLGNPVAPVSVDKVIEITGGTDSLGKADILWADERTLAASATENLDLAGAIAGLLGTTIAAAEITAIYLEGNAANTNDVVFFGAASNAFNGILSGTTPKVAVGPGDCVLHTNRKGVAVTAGTGDIILVANSAGGTGVTYRIVVFGRTVAA